MNKQTSLILWGALMSGSAVSSMPVTHTRPNIIIILADDLGYGDLSCYGAKRLHTPHIDQLAHEGLRLTKGYATSATSTPSRYALFTGMYPWKNKRAHILPGDAPLIISPDQPTLPKMMSQAGYRTGAIGKWHLGMGNGNIDWNKQIEPSANSIGFDYSCLIAATNDRVPTVYVENGRVIGLEADDPISVSYQKNFEGEPTALTHPERLKMRWSHGHNNSIVNGIPRIGFMKGGEKAKWIDDDMADFFVDRVQSFLSDNDDQPFFLYYGLHQPHVPRSPHSRFVGKSGLGPRGDAILEADWCVGELMMTLKKNGQLDNTLIIFSSDNGPVLDDGYKDQARELLGDHTPTGILRGGKYSLYEAGTRVPFILYWKGHLKPAASDAMVCQMDLFASLAKLVNQECPDGLDSENHLNAFLGKSEKGRKQLIIEAQGKVALRQDHYVLIPPYKGAQRNITQNEEGNVGVWTLFDLQRDPSETTNIFNAQPKLVEKMKKNLEQQTREFVTFPQ